MELTNEKKYELLGIDPEEICSEIQRIILSEEFYLLKEHELHMIQQAIGESIGLELDMEIQQNNTRLSLHTINQQVVVIKKKELDTKLLFELLPNIISIVNENDLKRIVGHIFCLILKLFVTSLDENISLVYSYLSQEFFVRGNKFSDEEICGMIREHVCENIYLNWSDERIRDMLLELRNLNVIESIDGFWNVRDKIVV